MNRSIAILAIVLLTAGCAEQPAKMTPSEQFDQLEKIFATENWRVVQGTDTNYLYASRLGDLHFNVYGFRIEAGDSAKTLQTTIRFERDSIRWDWLPGGMVLQQADSSEANWLLQDQAVVSFRKINADSIQVTGPSGQPAILTRTLPLATFLVRSHYDFLHGTHTVDSPLVPHRGPELK